MQFEKLVKPNGDVLELLKVGNQYYQFRTSPVNGNTFNIKDLSKTFKYILK